MLRLSRPKSTVPFGWREPVLACWYYPASCFAYSVFGMLVWKYADELRERCPLLWSWEVEGLGLMLQGPASFSADCLALGRSSWLHLMDLLLATGLTTSFVALFLTSPMDWDQHAVGWVGLVAGILCLWQSRVARRNPANERAGAGLVSFLGIAWA